MTISRSVNVQPEMVVKAIADKRIGIKNISFLVLIFA